MPYKLQKVRGKELYYVVNANTKKKYSKEPMPLAKAKKQLVALHIHTKE